jgi:hypothetical protein
LVDWKRREVSERECRVGEIGEDIQNVKDGSERRACRMFSLFLDHDVIWIAVRKQIETRRKNLADRREVLALAKEQHDIEVSYETEEEAEGAEAK